MANITRRRIDGRYSLRAFLPWIIPLALVWALLLPLLGLWSMQTTTPEATSSSSLALEEEDLLSDEKGNIVTLHLELDPAVDIRFRLFKEDAPDAARFVHEILESRDIDGCNLYRAEPVPEWWGSEDRPDSWDGGRWGPPYALIQGQLIKPGNNGDISPAVAESHRPEIKRGMVAWAGGRGGPHFFVALADHPEWKTSHTVWAEVVSPDLPKLDALLLRPLKTIKPKQPPILSYFVHPIDFSLGYHR